MEQNEMTRIAERNFEDFSMNDYPGRVIIMGMNSTGTHLVQLYAIMGRSENSQNRIFVVGQNGQLSTEAADPSKVKDPSLIIYMAMAEKPMACYVVSNGAQTQDILDAAVFTGTIGDLRGQEWKYEPDRPNWTPRINGGLHLGKDRPMLEFSIFKRSRYSDACERVQYFYDDLTQGIGRCIHTYDGDGEPLPTFCKEPYLVPIGGETAEEILDQYWETLNAKNRVSLAVKMINLKTGQSAIQVINQYKAVEELAQ